MKKNAFSLTELIISLLIISIITAAFTPVLTKKLKNQNKSLTQGGLIKNCTQIENCNICAKKLLPPTEGGGSEYICLDCKNKCNTNQYQKKEDCSCVDCDKNCISCTSEECAACAPGYGKNGKKCTQCNAGQFSDGQNACAQCNPGTYSSKGAANCAKCPAGTYSQNGASNCAPCPSGYAQNQAGQSGCWKCGAGTFSQSGQTGCALCPIGTYSDDGASNCAPCPSGTFKDSIGGGNISTCQLCPFGSYPNAKQGATGCLPIPSGHEYVNGQLKQITCALGKYLSAGKCIDCPIGTKGSASNGVNTCIPCPAGYAQDKTGQTGCWPCGAGTYSQSGQAGCTVCYGVTYQINANGHQEATESAATICSSCSGKFGEHCSNCTNSKCTECKSGYGLMENESAKSSNRACCKKKTDSDCGANAYFVANDSSGCKGICITKVNAGDAELSTLISGICTINTNTGAQTGDCSNNSKCWQGRTSNDCKNQGLYGACNRTVCTWEAAKQICANIKWDLPSWGNNGFEYIKDHMKDIQMCSTTDATSRGYAQCGQGVGLCPNSKDGVCFPDSFWGKNYNGSSNIEYMWFGVANPSNLNEGSTFRYGASDHQNPRGVRCVKSLGDNTIEY